MDDRLVLIGYYSHNGRTSIDRLRLRTHVLWMIENHPEHPATGEPSLRDLPDDDVWIDANGVPTERRWLGGQEVIVHYDDLPAKDRTVLRGIPITTITDR